MPKKLLTGADLAGQRITNLGDATSAGDAVTKAQLDSLAKGVVWKSSVKAATTANITLSGNQTIDGVATANGDRILVKNQTNAVNNGIYIAASGGWVRSDDLDENAEFTNGVAVFSQQGTANADKSWIVTNDGLITVGTTSLAWTQFGGGNTYTAGNGLVLSGSSFSVVPKAGGGLIVDGTGVYIDPTFSALAKRYSQDVPSGNTTATVTHNLGTTDVVVQVRLNSSGEVVEPDILVNGTNTVQLIFSTAPTSGQYRVTVVA